MFKVFKVRRYERLPCVHIGKIIMYLNQSCLKLFPALQTKFVTLLWDAETQTIGLRPEKNITENVLVVRKAKNGTGCQVWIRKLVKEFKIKAPLNICNMQWNEELGLLEIPLPNEDH